MASARLPRPSLLEAPWAALSWLPRHEPRAAHASCSDRRPFERRLEPLLCHEHSQNKADSGASTALASHSHSRTPTAALQYGWAGLVRVPRLPGTASSLRRSVTSGTQPRSQPSPLHTRCRTHMHTRAHAYTRAHTHTQSTASKTRFTMSNSSGCWLSAALCAWARACGREGRGGRSQHIRTAFPCRNNTARTKLLADESH